MEAGRQKARAGRRLGELCVLASLLLSVLLKPLNFLWQVENNSGVNVFPRFPLPTECLQIYSRNCSFPRAEVMKEDKYHT